MENQDFKIGIKTVWFLVVGNLLLTLFGALAKIQHWEEWLYKASLKYSSSYINSKHQ
jgi:hypothetical protein|tara:strand:- start:104 stop:274 length:171 start_codon:yes stop_codon:yes gene_type:complete